MTTIIVAKDGTGQYTNIQAGINAANPGDIIQVKNGLYPEKVNVDEQVKLYSQNRFGAIIDGSSFSFEGQSKFWEGDSLVKIIADNVIFSNFKVQNSKSNGILSINADNLIIEKNLTYKTWSSGIQVHDGTNLKILYNEIDKAANPDINRGNPQENLSIASPRNNMSGFEVAYNYIHGGNVADNGVNISGNGGIYCKQGCKNGSVHHNYVANIRYGVGEIYIDSWDLVNQNIDVYKNLLEGEGHIGVTTEAGGTCNYIIVRENIMTGNARGFVTPNSNRTGIISNLSIKDNIIYKNGGGLWLGRSPFTNIPTYSNVLVQNNIVCNNGEDPQIKIDSRIPTSAYNSDILTSNHTQLDYITQSQFDLKYIILKNEIFGIIPYCSTPVLSMTIY